MPRPRVTVDTERALAGYVSAYVQLIADGVPADEAVETIGSAVAGIASTYPGDQAALDAVIGLLAVAVGKAGDGFIARNAAGG